MGVPPYPNHQAENLAKLRLEFLSVLELRAKIFGAVSRTISLMRLSALLARKRCRCRDDGFCSCYLARLKNGNIEMKSKEKPSTQAGAY